MTVLVAYASRHGATAGIAERIAATLTGLGIPAEAKPVDQVGDIEQYGAVVVGSAAYMYHWLKPAVRFVKQHRDALAARPVWMFSSGPLGTDLVDQDGNDILDAMRPKDWEKLEPMVHPRGDHVFFGAWDPDAPPEGFVERMFRHLPAPKEELPSGDFRDWEAIDAWAGEIAAELRAEQPAAGTPPA